MPKPVTEFEVVIESVAFGAKGIAHIDQKVVFVPDVLPDEMVKIKITKDRGDYFESTLLAVIKPSKYRIAPLEAFILPRTDLTQQTLAYSPGFAYYFTSYKYEVELKQAQFLNFLSRLDGFKKKMLLKPIASKKSDHYRNKIQLHYQNDHGEHRLGYYKVDNSNVLDLPACPLADEHLNVLLNELRHKPGFFHTLREGMTLTLRYTENDRALMWRNAPPKNSQWLKEKTSIGIMSVPLGSFFQINPDVGSKLIESVQTLIASMDIKVVYDLFCGVGIFGIAAALASKNICEVIGCDADPEGIKAANYNAQQRGLQHVIFQNNGADNFFKEVLSERNHTQTCLIVDPPRTGLSPIANRLIAESQIPHIIYISCSPDTLMRDLAKMMRAGYTIKSTQLADMFPRTPHFETITYLFKV